MEVEYQKSIYAPSPPERGARAPVEEAYSIVELAPGENEVVEAAPEVFSQRMRRWPPAAARHSAIKGTASGKVDVETAFTGAHCEIVLWQRLAEVGEVVAVPAVSMLMPLPMELGTNAPVVETVPENALERADKSPPTH